MLSFRKDTQVSYFVDLRMEMSIYPCEVRRRKRADGRSEDQRRLSTWMKKRRWMLTVVAVGRKKER